MTGVTTRGVLYIHSSPRAMCAHVEWVTGNILARAVSLEWTDQVAAPGCLRAELSWQAEQGTGARLASALRGWTHLRFEVTEEASRGADGSRWSHTPELGIFHSPIDVHGNALIPEDRIRAAFEPDSDLVATRHRIDLALGQAWDDELEPFRYAGAGAPIRWLHQVG